MAGYLIKRPAGWVVVFYGSIVTVEGFLDMLKNSEMDQDAC
jgi:hypothetical protein